MRFNMRQTQLKSHDQVLDVLSGTASSQNRSPFSSKVRTQRIDVPERFSLLSAAEQDCAIDMKSRIANMSTKSKVWLV